MKNSAPLIAAIVGFTLILLAIPEGFVLSALAALHGQEPETLKAESATVTLSMTVLGACLLLGGIVRYALISRHSSLWGPYDSALSRLAMEHGQGLFPLPGGGIGFQSAREGRKLEVQALPGTPPILVVKQAVPARQPLLFVKLDGELPAAQAHFKPAGEGRNWELFAELPALARAHMNDMGVVHRMDRFFDLAESEWISHDANGIEIVCSLPAPALVAQRAREALGVLAYLRQVNG